MISMTSKILRLLGLAFALNFPLAAKDFNVLDFGAKGDGATLDTPAIQRAIDAAAAGGGRVVVPRGRKFVVATLALRGEIADVLLKKTEELSKGMQQKIQFIASLLHEPGLIIMDEPFSGLDPVNAVLVEKTLLELKDQGKAILFSTHRMDQVEKLCDTICLINNGQAVLAGKVRQIKATYERDRVIVEFEGSPSFLSSDEIAAAKNFSGHAEIKLKPHGNAQKLLHEAAAVATIYRFELVEPSLEEIFIQTVGGKSDA